MACITHSTYKIASFPDVVMKNILFRLPVRDIISSSIVCLQWNKFIHEGQFSKHIWESLYKANPARSEVVRYLFDHAKDACKYHAQDGITVANFHDHPLPNKNDLFSVLEHTLPLEGASAIHLSDQRAFIGDWDGNMHIWSLKGNTLLKQFKTFGGPICSLYSKNESLFIGFSNGTLQKWDSNPSETYTFPFKNDGPIIHISETEKYLITISDRGQIVFWDKETLGYIGLGFSPFHSPIQHCIHFNGLLVAISCYEDKMHIIRSCLEDKVFKLETSVYSSFLNFPHVPTCDPTKRIFYDGTFLKVSDVTTHECLFSVQDKYALSGSITKDSRFIPFAFSQESLRIAELLPKSEFRSVENSERSESEESSSFRKKLEDLRGRYKALSSSSATHSPFPRKKNSAPPSATVTQFMRNKYRGVKAQLVRLLPK